MQNIVLHTNTHVFRSLSKMPRKICSNYRRRFICRRIQKAGPKEPRAKAVPGPRLGEAGGEGLGVVGVGGILRS